MIHRSSSSKRAVLWCMVGLGIVLVVALMAYLAKQEPSKNTKEPMKEISKEGKELLTVSPQDHIKGNTYAKVILVEYSDLQCPACGAYYPILKRVEKEFGSKILFVYRHFPLSTIHLHAELAAQAAEAAGKQGKFWEMHDMLFEYQPAWSSEKDPEKTLISYAEKLHLDSNRFKHDLRAQDTKEKISKDVGSGSHLGVQGTPTFFLAGKQISQNPQNFEEFSQLISNAVASQ